MVLQVRALSKEYGGRTLFREVNFHLSVGERVALVGRNGTGKTTLLRILAGEVISDSGSVQWVRPGLSVRYLKQEGAWDPAALLGDQIGHVPPDMLRKCGVTRNMLAQAAASLSGGEKVRAGLSRALAGKPGVLLLDEPTNHLDIDGMEWLEGFLAAYDGAVIVVSHDRYFLDRTAQRVLELDQGRVKNYPGNYSAYASVKRAEQERQGFLYEQYVKEKKRLTEAMHRQAEWARMATNAELPDDAQKNARVYMNASAEAAMKRVKATEKRIERIRVEKPREARAISIAVDGSRDVGKTLILARDLGFSFDGTRWLFRNASFFVQREDRVAIVGPNGSGKTTLVRLLLNQLEPTEGSLHVAPAKVAYLAQETECLTPENTVLQEVSGDTALDQPATRSLLGCLLFEGEDVLKQIRVLSRGEKVRVALAKILLQEHNLLVLDEPTNGLDLESRERVEDALETVSATMIIVSHDRYLLKRLSTRVLSLEEASIRSYPGSYEEYHARPKKQAQDDIQDRVLLLETRLARLSSLISDPKAPNLSELSSEFVSLSRELNALRSERIKA